MVFLDGATKANNPVTKLWQEAAAVFGDDFEDRLQLALSIGTGVPQLRAFGNDFLSVAKTMVKLATETEDTNADFERAHKALVRDDRFFRFNVHVGLADIGLERVGEQARIRAATHKYLELMDVQRRLDSFKARAIAGGMWRLADWKPYCLNPGENELTRGRVHQTDHHPSSTTPDKKPGIR